MSKTSEPELPPIRMWMLRNTRWYSWRSGNPPMPKYGLFWERMTWVIFLISLIIPYILIDFLVPLILAAIARLVQVPYLPLAVVGFYGIRACISLFSWLMHSFIQRQLRIEPNRYSASTFRWLSIKSVPESARKRMVSSLSPTISRIKLISTLHHFVQFSAAVIGGFFVYTGGGIGETIDIIMQIIFWCFFSVANFLSFEILQNFLSSPKPQLTGQYSWIWIEVVRVALTAGIITRIAQTATHWLSSHSFFEGNVVGLASYVLSKRGRKTFLADDVVDMGAPLEERWSELPVIKPDEIKARADTALAALISKSTQH